MNTPPASADTLGSRLRWLIVFKLGRRKQAEFARRIEVERALLQKWLDGKFEPDRHHFERIVEETGVDPGWLRYGRGEPYPDGGRPSLHYPESEEIQLFASAAGKATPEETALTGFRKAIEDRVSRPVLLDLAGWAADLLNLSD